MKYYKYILLVIIGILLISCNSYKYEFQRGPTYLEFPKNFSESFKYLKEDELFICFTKKYNLTKIKVLENNKILLDSFITTDNRNIAKTLKVNVNSKVEIYFEKERKPLVLTKEQMNLYKFIYFEKNKKKIIVDFNNSTKKI